MQYSILFPASVCFKKKLVGVYFLCFWLKILHIYYSFFSGCVHFCLLVGNQFCCIWVYFMIGGSTVLRTGRTYVELCHPLRHFHQEGGCMVFYMLLRVFRVKFFLRFPGATTEALFFDLFVIPFSFTVL